MTSLLKVAPVFAIALAATLVSALCASRVDASPRPFTAKDSIELPRIVNFSGRDYQGNTVGNTALFSPDGKRFLIETRQGDTTHNVNIETLLLFDSVEVEKYLVDSSPGNRPKHVQLARFEIPDERRKIGKVKWVDNDNLEFIAIGVNGKAQGFHLDVRRAKLEQLTHSPTDVKSFAKQGDTVLYYAEVESSQPDVATVSGEMLIELIDPKYPDFAKKIALFQASTRTAEIRRVEAVPISRLVDPSDQIWLSPSGDVAVIFTPATNAPLRWADYRMRHYDLVGYLPEMRRSDPTSLDLLLRTRYTLLDLKRGTAAPLLDAPSGWMSQSMTPPAVFWPKRAQSVVVAGTYLPLDASDERVNDRRRTTPAVAEVDLASRTVKTIAWETVPPEQPSQGGAAERIASFEWEPDSSTLTIIKSASGKVIRTELQKIAGNWVETKGSHQRGPLGYSVVRRESLNERPRLYATSDACQCSREILDPAPSADQFAFGRTEVVTWIEKTSGIEWEGGLVFPPGYASGKRYPLVVQTHGFDRNGFLIDGAHGTTTAMSAQALANSGILVLQVEDDPAAKTLDAREAKLYADGFRAGIDHMVQRGLVDPGRVGLIAFSRTGFPAIRFLADYPDVLAAATIADAAWWGYLIELLLVNAPSDSIKQRAKTTGVFPQTSDLPSWIESNPLYKLPNARAALRLEAMGSLALLGHWEQYSLMLKARRPVEFVYFPNGSHQLQKPAERLASQGGNVDWFRFWLQDFEDPDPSKQQQYARWRALRENAAERTRGSSVTSATMQ